MAKWLKAGVVEFGNFRPTDIGVPQGGIISPVISNMALDGMAKVIEDSVKHLRTKRYAPKVYFVRFADDFVVTADKREFLTENVIPAIEGFLAERGVHLSKEKTRIVTLLNGFNFVGFNFRVYLDHSREGGQILLIKPKTQNVVDARRKISEMVKKAHDPFQLILQLNAYLRGWAYYYRISIAKRVFTALGAHLWLVLWNWVKRRHRGMPRRELLQLYFKTLGDRNYVFFGVNPENPEQELTLYDIANTPIVRHGMITNRNPYLPENYEYFQKRVKSQTLVPTA